MTSADCDAALEALERAVEGRPFTTAEVAALRELISGDGPATLREVLDAYRAWRTLGRLARFAIVTLGLIAGGIAGFDVVAAKVRAWLG